MSRNREKKKSLSLQLREELLRYYNQVDDEGFQEFDEFYNFKIQALITKLKKLRRSK